MAKTPRESEVETERICIDFHKNGVDYIRELLGKEENKEVTLDLAVEALAQMGAATMLVMEEVDIRRAQKIVSLMSVQRGQKGGVIAIDISDLMKFLSE